MKSGKGGIEFQGNCNYCGEFWLGPRHESEDFGAKREEEKGRKDRDPNLTVDRTTLDRGRVAAKDGKQKEDLGTAARKRLHRQGWNEVPGPVDAQTFLHGKYTSRTGTEEHFWTL